METKVAAYCRVSTEKEDQLSSLDMQKEFFEEYARLHHYDLVQLYADEGISGTKLRNRKAFNQMMHDARQGKFERVFVKDISRFARNAVDFLQSIRELKAMGIKCEFVNANLSTEDGEFTLGILALVAQEESANISKRVKFGKHKNAQNGKVPNLVYGYNKIEDELFELEVNPLEAAVVRRIYDLYTEEGYGSCRIAKLLNQEGIGTKRNCRWSSTTVSRILKNPIYTGSVTNGKEEVQDFLTGVRIKKQQESWIICENQRLQIISKEQFEKAQRRLREHQQKPGASALRQTSRYAFSSLIRCEVCGYHFRRISRPLKQGMSVKWVCSGHNGQGNSFCTNKTTLDEAELLREIGNYFNTLIHGKKSFPRELFQRVEKDYKQAVQKTDQYQLGQELKMLEKQKRKQIQMFEVDAVSLEQLKEATAALNERIQRCQKKLSAIQGCRLPDLEQYIKSPCAQAEALLCEQLTEYGFLHDVIGQISVKEDGEVQIYLK